MLKKSLLLMLFVALLAPWAAKGQVQIGSGTATNAYLPTRSYNKYTISQQIYTAEEINASGTITSLSFYRTDAYTGANNARKFDIYMAHTSKSAFASTSDWESLTADNLVYHGTDKIALPQNEWYAYTLETPFDYNGTDNLIIVIIDRTGEYSAYNQDNTYLVFSTTNKQAMYATSDNYTNLNPNGTNGSTSLTGTQQQIKNQIILGGIEQSCAAPSTLEASYITESQATLTWTGGSGTYNVEYKKASDTEWTPVLSNTPLLTTVLPVLEAQTSYNARVQSVCTGETSSWTTTSFETPCSSISTLPWNEDFKDMTANTVPDCWDNTASTSPTLSTNPHYIWGVYSYGSGANANKMLRMYNSMVKSGTALINTQPITLPTGDIYQLTFDYSNRASCGAFSVKISEDGGTTFVQMGSYQQSSSSNATDPGTFIPADPIILTSYAGKTIIVQFYAEADYGSGAIFLDNVSIDLAPTCLQPTNLSATEDEPNQSVLNWTDNNGTAPANGWTVYYKKASETEYTPKSVSSKPYTLPDLSSATNYQYYVVANCTSEDESDPSAVYSFRTACPEYKDVPFTESFDDITLSSAWTPSANTLPLCWDYINTCTNTDYKYYPTVYYYSYTDYSKSSPNSLKFYSYYSSDPKDQYAILPAVQNLSGLRIKLFARLYSTSYDGTFTIGVMTDPTDASTFTQVGDPLIPSSTTYEPFTVSFSSYTGTGTHIAIKMAAATSSYRAVFIDDVTVEEIPSCVEPTGLAEVPETATDHSLTFNWTAGGTETTWKIQYKKSTESEWTTYPDPVTSKPFILPGLEASSVYNVRVAAWCNPSDPEGISSYSEPATARTECGAITVDADHHFNENFNDYTAGTSSSAVPSNYPNDELPLCWRFLNRSTTSSTYPMVFLSSYSDYAVSGNCLFFKSSNTTPIYAILPEFTNNISDMMLTFTYRNEGTTSGNGTLYVSYMTDPTDATTFNTDDAVECEKTTSKKEKEVSFANAPAGSYIAFKYQGGNSNMYLSIDDVTVEPVPTCIKPSALACNSKTAHTATMSWTNGAATQDAWQIAYSTNPSFAPAANFTPGENEWLVDVTTNPATIEGLAQSTTYYAYVRANCGGGDYSAWCKTKATFTTLAGNVTPTGLAVAPATITNNQATANWNAVEGNTEHQSYDIYWDLATVETVPAEPTAPNLITGITATSQVIEGLASETSYKVWVRDFCGTDGYSNWSSAVTFTTAADCQTPDGLHESNVTENSATITWNTYGKTEFNLAYSSDGGENWTTITGIGCPYTFPNNLQANTPYKVKVQATCNTEVWSAELNFRTECGAMTITATDYINEGFEEYTGVKYNLAGVVPYCWDNYSEGTGYPYPHIVDKTLSTDYAYVHDGDKSLNFIGESNANAYVVLPEFTNDLSTLMVNFWMKTEGNPNPVTYKLTLGYITDEDNYFTAENNFFNTYQALDEYANTTTMTERTTYLKTKTIPANAARLVFRWEHPTTSWHACCIDDVIVKLGPTCLPVGTLSYDNDDVMATSAKVSWTLIDNSQTEWDVQYATNAAFTEGVKTVAADTNEEFELSPLTPTTHYYVRVKAACSENDWSNVIDFTTLEACPTPTGLAANDLTQFTADLSWNGESDSYNIKYRTAATPTSTQLFFEGFETYADEAALEAVWTVLDLGDGENTDELGLSTAAKKNNNYGFRFSSYNGSSSGTFDQYLISPLLDNTGMLEFAYKSSNGTSDVFRVGYSSTTNDVSAFTWSDEINSASSWKTFSEAMPENAKYFAINYTAVYKFYLYIDDIAIYEMQPAGEWQDATSTTASKHLPGLSTGTKYEAKVQGVCSETPGNWCDAISFTTLDEHSFVFVGGTTGNEWGTGANWIPNEAPGLDDNAIIRANVTIENNCVAQANNITFEGSETLEIADGGQLIANTDITATAKKSITGYGTTNVGSRKGFYFIAPPIYATFGTNPTAAGLITDDNTDPNNRTYDLYQWVSTAENEWKNFRSGTFQLYNGDGYLYANVNDVELSFNGTILNNSTPKEVNLDYSTGSMFGAWNLIGNPFACAANISITSGTANYYKIGTGENEGILVPSSGSVAPMEGIFVQAETTGQKAKFTRVVPGEESTGDPDGILEIALSTNNNRGLSRVDNARVRFGEGNELEKFQLYAGSTKLYIPQDGTDYAVVYSEAKGTMPINLKVAETGTYTISFSNEDVEFNYLHLIDNFTGEDIDLLIDDSYTFSASVRDKESRFTLVFNTIDSNYDPTSDIFVYQNDDQLIVNGEGTLQVYDVMGRFVASYEVNGNMSINASQFSNAVYIFRMVGTDVKTQKIVVR